MIDKTSGSIILEEGKAVLNASMTTEDFKTTPLYNFGEVEPSYRLEKAYEINNKRFFITVYFMGGYLKEIHLSEEIPSLSWADWTEENELKKKKRHDEWLTQMLGEEPYTYTWGRIESIFDRKGCLSSIIVRYC